MGAKIVGTSTAHCALLELLAKVAPTDAEVLINGPTGVGKELYARYIHDHSRRSAAPFIPVNCGSLANELLENVLFGHIGGAYTDAKSNSEGLVQSAEGGTLFLDEVDTLSIPCQIKLLRFLQDREFRRLGETRIRKVDVRIVAATNTDLIKAIDKGLFREDLFFRLRVFPVDVPRLATRIKDIDVLVAKSIKDAAADYNLPPIKLSPQSLEYMREYSWPGNIRELENCIRYLTCLQTGQLIQPEELPLLKRPPHVAINEMNDVPSLEHELTALERPLKTVKQELVGEFERRYIESALSRSGGNVSQAARDSGKRRRVFFELMRKYDIDPAVYRLSTQGSDSDESSAEPSGDRTQSSTQ